jgi:hypothetical protein
MAITLKNVFDSESNIAAELSVTIKYSINSAFVGYLIFQYDILVLHIIAVSDSHFSYGYSFYLTNRKLSFMFYVFLALKFICLWLELFPCFLLIVSSGKFDTSNHSRWDNMLLQELLNCSHLLEVGRFLLFVRLVRSLGRHLHDILNRHPSHFVHLNTIVNNIQIFTMCSQGYYGIVWKRE